MGQTLRAVGKNARALSVSRALACLPPTLCHRCALASGSAAQLSSDNRACSFVARCDGSCEPVALGEPCQQRWTTHSPQCGAAARTAEHNRESVQTAAAGPPCLAAAGASPSPCANTGKRQRLAGAHCCQQPPAPALPPRGSCRGPVVFTPADSEGWTALHLAAEQGHAECLQQLVSAGANIEVADSGGCTALHLASEYGYAKCLRALLSAGASIEAANSEGFTALDLALHYGHAACAQVLEAATAAATAEAEATQAAAELLADEEEEEQQRAARAATKAAKRQRQKQPRRQQPAAAVNSSGAGSSGSQAPLQEAPLRSALPPAPAAKVAGRPAAQPAGGAHAGTNAARPAAEEAGEASAGAVYAAAELEEDADAEVERRCSRWGWGRLCQPRPAAPAMPAPQLQQQQLLLPVLPPPLLPGVFSHCRPTPTPPAAPSPPADLDPALLSQLVCPITHEVMVDPVFASDGTTFERAAIQGGCRALGCGGWAQWRG